MKKTKPEPRSWVVTARCVVVKTVVCEDCTEAEARSDPFDHAVEETEVEQVDWEVTAVEPNV